MNTDRIMALIDGRQFRDLFVDHLGWSNPDQPDLSVEVDGSSYSLHQIAGYKGLRVWYAPILPARRVQRLIDAAVGQYNHERLIIFADDQTQAWRWPRRAKLGGANAKLVLHQHNVGEPDERLVRQLKSIAVGFEEDLTLVELLARMREVFDAEAETTSEQAARLMGNLYSELEAAGWDQHDATLLLARLLFLFFADDSGMWNANMFQSFVREQTTPETLADDLATLFTVLDQKDRDAGLSESIRSFRYVNGGLFAGDLQMGRLSAEFRDELLAAGEFDWSAISPAVFGSMFQTVKSRADRRGGGEHYTTEKNILRTINPLFMDRLRERLDRAWNDQGQLTKLHNDLGRIRVLDPACGCGNFLIVAYRELRALELDLLLRKRELDVQDKNKVFAQLTFDVSAELKVTLDHFFGIEIEEWPARIAETAMLLVDHLANQRMTEDFGDAPDRLPIRIAPKIHLGSALQVDWNDVVPASELTYIVGNPPFNGSRRMSAAQKAELRRVARGFREVGFLDYVAAWYILAANMMQQNPTIECALVSTNSITQGEQPAIIWRPFYERGLHINFAHRTFDWENESRDQAAVDCVIVGFSARDSQPKRLFFYETGSSEPIEAIVSLINPYLLEGIEYVVGNRQTQISSSRPMAFGNMPADNGNLILTVEAREAILSDYPQADAWILPFYGSREYLNSRPRYCLWLEGVAESEWREVPEIVRRVESNRRVRENSSRPTLASIPQLFAQRSQRPNAPFLLVPSASSERRRYIPMGFFERGVVASNLALTIVSATPADFAILTSEMHMDWVRVIGGRLESRYRYSKDVVYNNFVFPALDDDVIATLNDLGSEVLSVRAEFADRTPAWLYNEETMPRSLRHAHREIDGFVDRLYRSEPFIDGVDRVRLLLDLHRQREDGLLARPRPSARKQYSKGR